MSRTVFSRGIAIALVAASVTFDAGAATDVYGKIDFHRIEDIWSGFCSGTYQDERQFFGTVSSADTEQIGMVDIDIAAGTVRGINSAQQLDGNQATTTTVAWAFPEVQVVALPGAPVSDAVLLDIRVTLDGYFETYIFTGSSSAAYSTFDATLSLHFPGVASSRAQAIYSYDWLRTLTGDDFRHQKFVSAEPCAGCFAEVIVEDPLDEIRNGFTNITLRTTISLEPGAVIVPDLYIESESAVAFHGAYADWSSTAQFSYQLPAGYILATIDGEPLTAWAAAPVPEPAPVAILLAGVGLVTLAARRRHEVGGLRACCPGA